MIPTIAILLLYLQHPLRRLSHLPQIICSSICDCPTHRVRCLHQHLSPSSHSYRPFAANYPYHIHPPPSGRWQSQHIAHHSHPSYPTDIQWKSIHLLPLQQRIPFPWRTERAPQLTSPWPQSVQVSQVQEEGKVGFGINSAHWEWGMWNCGIPAGCWSCCRFYERVHEEAHDHCLIPVLYWLTHATFRAATHMYL